MRLTIFVVFAAALAHGRAVSNPQPAPAPPPLAKHPGDVISAAVSNFALVGGVSYVWTAGSAVVTRKAGPLALAKASGLRWGKVSSGFAGGRALGQLWRKTDDKWCGVVGAIFGGAAAAGSVADMPSSIFSFVAFGLVIDTFLVPPSPSGTAGKGVGGDEKIEWRGRSADEIRADAIARDKRQRALK